MIFDAVSNCGEQVSKQRAPHVGGTRSSDGWSTLRFDENRVFPYERLFSAEKRRILNLCKSSVYLNDALLCAIKSAEKAAQKHSFGWVSET